jgi:hypothetical protein
MGRAIVASKPAPLIGDTASRGVPDGDTAADTSGDGYGDRLLKLIPGEVISLYLSMVAIVRNSVDAADDPWAPWVILAIGACATWIYLRFTLKVTNKVQLTLSVCAFLVWAVTIAGQLFADNGFAWVGGTYSGIALAAFTFLAPIIPINDAKKTPGNAR